MRDATCIFCRIIGGDIPSHRVYEDQMLIAFLDIHPTTRGHTLLVPRDHIDSFARLSPELAAAFGSGLLKIAPRIAEAVSADGFNLILNTGKDAGQVVPHVHWHIIPRYASDGLRPWPGEAAAPQDLEMNATLIQNNLSGI